MYIAYSFLFNQTKRPHTLEVLETFLRLENFSSSEAINKQLCFIQYKVMKRR